jgi:hypothetical protein
MYNEHSGDPKFVAAAVTSGRCLKVLFPTNIDKAGRQINGRCRLMVAIQGCC